MEDLEKILTESDLKLRERWLFWVIKIPACFFAFIFLLVLSSIIATYPIRSVSDPAGPVLSFSVIEIFFWYLILWAYYYFAYKNHGTIFLILTFMVMGFEVIWSFGQFLSGLASYTSIFYFFWYLLYFSFISFYFYLNFRLFVLNEKINSCSIKNSDAYQSSIHAFESASGPEECQQIFNNLLHGVESPIIRQGVIAAYKDFVKNTADMAII